MGDRPVEGGAGGGWRAARRRPAQARPQRGGRLSGQSHRALVLGAARHAILQPRAGDPFALLGDLRRSVASHARGVGDVRPPAHAAGARRRPDRLLPHARRQPVGLERQPDDGGRHLAATEGAAQARRKAGGHRSTALGDRCRGGPVLRHPPRHRRASLARLAARGVRRSARRPAPPRTVHRRPGGPARDGGAVPA